MTFQQDLKESFQCIHNKYVEGFGNFIEKEELLNSLNLDKASNIVNNLQIYSKLIDDILGILENISIEKDDENLDSRENKITNKLKKKIIPVMILYRQVLELKYPKDFLPT